MTLSLDSARAAVPPLYRKSEPEVLAPLVVAAQVSGSERTAIGKNARGLLADLRDAQSDGWVNQFLQEYRLGTEEGTALLSLAEAFLRVPDPETADLLIADKLTDADWRGHKGQSSSLLVNSATWGLVLGKAVLGDSESSLKRLISRAGEPFVRQAVGAAMRLMGQVFVMGRNIDEAIKRMESKDNRGFTASFDMLGEAARTKADAERYFQAYVGAIAAVGKKADRGHSVSVKLSALHPRYETAQAARCVPELAEMLRELARSAASLGVQLTVDAEEAARLEMSFDIIEAVARDSALGGWDGLGMAVQAYSKRARPTIAWVNALGASTNRIMQVRLVKGAYWDSEIKHAQERGLSDFPLFTRKPATDVSYLACAKDMFAAKNIRPAFASHNALTVATILEWAGDSRDFEFQRLHGMGEGLFERLVRKEGYHCRTYAPVGGHRDLLAYLVRRLLENGANSSFVHQLADQSVSEDELLADPVDKVMAVGGMGHPAIALPADLFQPERANSNGMDLDDVAVLADIASFIARHPREGGGPSPKLTAYPKGQGMGSRLRGNDEVGVDKAVTTALSAYPDWSRTPLEERADCLDRLADLLEEHRSQLMAIAVQEAKKTIPDALAEVREAIDFCRYYAARGRSDLSPVELPGPTGERNVLRHEGRGVWVAIAPWNFPLAIFLGQVAAALVAGNTVVAKPAPQTPAIGAFAVELAHRAGVPKAALQLVVGGGEVGAALTEDVRIAGVVFTGSVPTAKAIARSLLADDARPLVPLIAETGGLNAMIVDSTALSEQVVRDVIVSGFQSAGQRCSALRLLLLQEDIAEHTLEMLSGAMDTLNVGDPADPATDIGPVIDQTSYDKLMAYRDSVKDRIVHSIPVPTKGLFVPPTVIRIDNLDQLNTEWFGPLVHVATWKAGTLEDTVHRVNAKGFGLTMGLHSRIARSSEAVENLARVGNLYVNRSMIGAVVGSQPFGGEGLSGTGPKAGGPHYLYRFCAERTTSTDTTSAGGNASLLSLED